MHPNLAATTPRVNQLPPEVLGRCFEFLQLRDRIGAAAVCARWRSIALEHADLWCELNNVGMDALPHLLARTKRAGVRLTAHSVADVSIDSLCQLILPHMDHIRLLDLELQPWRDRKDWTALGRVLSAQAPRLGEFSLVIHKLPTSLNLPLFGGVAPKLRSLRMEGWTFTVPSAATQNVVSFQAPGVVHTTEQAVSPFYTSAWAEIFPAVRELHLSELPETAGLWSPDNAFPTQLTTLVLEFTRDAPPHTFTDAFRLLQQANFDSMREITLVYADPALVDLVLQFLGDSVVSLELTGGGAHVRLVTEMGTAINFMRASVPELDEAVFQNIKHLSRLRTLHLGAGVLCVFDGLTITRLCLAAQGIERLVMTGMPNPLLWDRWDVLELPALRDLHVREVRAAPVWADDLEEFVRNRLRVRASPAQLRLTFAEGVVVSDDREDCEVSRKMLDELLTTFFGEITFATASQTEGTPQRAEAFARPTDRYETDLWFAQGY